MKTKKIMLAVVFAALVSTASAAEVYSRFSVDSMVPFKDNAYNIIWGGGYELKLAENRFVFMAGLKGYAGSAKASQSDGMIYGLYKDDWNTGPFMNVAELNVDTLYLAGELSVSFGWHISYIFERDQYVFITLAALLESEAFSGDVEKHFLAGRYSTSFSFSSEAFKISENPVYFTVSFGSASLQDPAGPGNAFYFLKTSVTYEVPLKIIREVDKYRRSEETKEEGMKQEGEGGAVWEE